MNKNNSMFAKMVSLAVLSGFIMLGFILVWTNRAHTYYHLDQFGFRVTDHTDANAAWYVGIVFISVSGLASFVMGIVSLSTNKATEYRGLVTAAGILGIIAGGFGVNIIIALLAAFKAKSGPVNSNQVADISVQHGNEIEQLKREIQQLKSSKNQDTTPEISKPESLVVKDKPKATKTKLKD